MQVLGIHRFQPGRLARSVSSRLSWKIALVGAASFTLPVSTAATGLLLARAMPADEYGKVVFFFSVVGVVILVGSMGLGTRGRIVAARYSALPTDATILREATHLSVSRVATCGLLLIAACLLKAAQMDTVAAGLAVGSAALITDFFVSFLQGYGWAVFGSLLQVLPPLLYLASVIAIGLHRPRFGLIFTLVALSYLPSMCIAIGCFPPLLKIKSQLRRLAYRELRRDLISASRIYILTLVTAFSGMFGTLILGSLNLYTEDAAFGLALSIATFPASASNIMQNAVYYPRYCWLLAQKKRSEAANYFDVFYRILMCGGIAGSTVLICYSGDLLAILFANKYAFASTPLRFLAPMIVSSLGVQLVIWTLVAQDRIGAAMLSACASLAFLLVGGSILLDLTHDSLSVFALAHTVASLLGLSIGLYLLVDDRRYRLHLGRMVIAVLVAGSIAMLMYSLSRGIGSMNCRMLLMVVAGLLCLGSSLLIGFGWPSAGNPEPS